MFRSRAFRGFTCVVLLSIVVAPTRARAAEGVDVDYIPYDAIAAVVLHPRRLLTSPKFELWPIEVATAVGMDYLGIDPAKVEQAIGVLGMTGLPAGQPGLGLILHFAEPYDKAAVMDRLGQSTAQATYNGKTYYKPTAQGGFGFAMPDERTLLVGTELALRGMLKPPKDPPPLVKLLEKVDTSKSAVAVLDFATVQPMVSLAIETLPPVPAPFNEFLLAHEHLSWVELEIDLEASPTIAFALGGNDEASASKLKELLEKAKVMGQQYAEVYINQMEAEATDATSRSIPQYLRRLLNKFAGEIEIAQTGDRVDVMLLKESPEMASTGVMVALMLPAVQAAREAARRNMSTNQMKQIAIAMHNYHDANKHFPARAITDADGNPLLSWRVALLPYLEQGGAQLYQEFHLDEPWDSEHNSKLIARMPAVYGNPNFAAPGMTIYLALVGEGTIFGGEALGIRRITDGTSNTAMIVEADPVRAVEWTRPDDLPVDMNNPMDGVGNLRPGIFNAAFADGSVHAISKNVDKDLLRALYTYAGGEVVEIPR
ncbi:MAG: DUF1559 domain-containing protein [Pirellulales bacterium]